ncbi:SIR2 family NAD-dependent protein deacylase [Bacilliculturomica massiliensis]|uniref:SIR2 family NAD-dependent protein deacylase n=1 Tax=Bacilliculturomica massiliensis TaxID=1917867 RepID=UPI001A916DDB|nr:Sir2 silent information regulator family NAD-dependent deacetylase [Bacilliculturomica massiliensis]
MKGIQIETLARWIASADAVAVGAGSGLSAADGMTYSGRRFEENFSDFIAEYHFPDMYIGGFYPFSTLEEYWAYWSRYIRINRYQEAPGQVYADLLALVEGRDYFVLTTNVDHCFQRAGFAGARLFYTQGDYGLWQCSKPCCSKTYDNEDAVRRMDREQKDMRIPTELIPRCPVCGRPMAMNLRCDGTFVQDEGWYRAKARYEEFLKRSGGRRVLFLELGVGNNTPGIIKYPFWQMTYGNPEALYACINAADVSVPAGIEERSVCIRGDIGPVLAAVREELGRSL